MAATLTLDQWIQSLTAGELAPSSSQLANSIKQYYSDQQTPEEYNIQFLDDIMYPEYKNVIWHDYEIVFIKGNRIV